MREGKTERAPPPRRHMRVCKQAKENEDWAGAEVHRPFHKSGVHLFCPLACLHLFNIVWDILLDFMHTVKNFWESRAMPTFKGERAPPPWNKPEPNKKDPDFKNKMKEYNRKQKAMNILCATHTLCTFSDANKTKVDDRVKNLCGEQDWINGTLVRSSRHTTLTKR